ncbi:MAG: hypothetical protein WAO23_07050 [Dethiobacteria bacterium]
MTGKVALHLQNGRRHLSFIVEQAARENSELYYYIILSAAKNLTR